MVLHDKPGSSIVMVCPPYPSHVQAFEALARELRARGHQVRYLCADSARCLPVPPVPPPARQRPAGLREDIAQGADRTDRLCRHGPALIAGLRADLILGDQTEPAAGLIAEHLGLPMISVACALPFDPEPGVPLPFLGWRCDPSPKGVERLASARRIATWVMSAHGRVLQHHADAWGLGRRRDFADCLSPALTLAQTPPGFDYPRPVGGARIRHLGPFRDAPTAPFPDDIRPDPERPFVFVSLGTLQGHRLALLARIARACRRAGAQVLVTHGQGLSGAQAARIPAEWVRAFVPQRAVLARADLCVTHAGLNTTLECLEQGVPMLALPLANDQPGVAARIAACGAGLRLSPRVATER
ncbi:glycosyltransferase, partial [Paracoccus liaowanqingii]